MTSSVSGVGAEQLIRNLWPQTRPPRPELTKGAAIALYELVRYLVYALEHQTDSLPTPADGRALTTNLRAVVDVGQQLFTRLAQWADALAYEPDLRQRRGVFDKADFPAAPEHARDAAKAFRWSYMHAA